MHHLAWSVDVLSADGFFVRPGPFSPNVASSLSALNNGVSRLLGFPLLFAVKPFPASPSPIPSLPAPGPGRTCAAVRRRRPASLRNTRPGASARSESPPWTLEPARSGVSRCHGSSQLISAGDWRFGAHVRLRGASRMCARWRHLQCAAEAFPAALLGSEPASVVRGWSRAPADVLSSLAPLLTSRSLPAPTAPAATAEPTGEAACPCSPQPESPSLPLPGSPPAGSTLLPALPAPPPAPPAASGAADVAPCVATPRRQPPSHLFPPVVADGRSGSRLRGWQLEPARSGVSRCHCCSRQISLGAWRLGAQTWLNGPGRLWTRWFHITCQVTTFPCQLTGADPNECVAGWAVAPQSVRDALGPLVLASLGTAAAAPGAPQVLPDSAASATPTQLGESDSCKRDSHCAQVQGAFYFSSVDANQFTSEELGVIGDALHRLWVLRGGDPGATFRFRQGSLWILIVAAGLTPPELGAVIGAALATLAQASFSSGDHRWADPGAPVWHEPRSLPPHLLLLPGSASTGLPALAGGSAACSDRLAPSSAVCRPGSSAASSNGASPVAVAPAVPAPPLAGPCPPLLREYPWLRFLDAVGPVDLDLHLARPFLTFRRVPRVCVGAVVDVMVGSLKCLFSPGFCPSRAAALWALLPRMLLGAVGTRAHFWRPPPG